ncbi:helix-turn-helix transcriptional regulator [Actinoallomurus vinaceus]|uniref:Helix-turn-helix transcriptional regulator n=1 Tax=Actinoallomurus vinaceus TaxID=1080074 RepID=A0ABP8U7W5_9ACTN
MPSRNIPSVRLRRIGSALRKAREDCGMTVGTASRRYGRSMGWLSTLENGLHPIDRQELADLLDFYGVPDGPLRESLLHLATHDPGKNWERMREGRISAAALDLASLEEDADLIRTFQPCLIPGLLQVPEYTRALIAVGPPSARRHCRALVAFRMHRQRVLHRADPPRYVAVIGEAALRHRVGDAPVMNAQIRRLAEAARSEAIEIRILPESAGAYLWLAGPFDLFRLRPPGRLSVTVVEQFTKSVFVDDEAEVAEHEEIFAKLLAVSLDRGLSLELIERIASIP